MNTPVYILTNIILNEAMESIQVNVFNHYYTDLTAALKRAHNEMETTLPNYCKQDPKAYLDTVNDTYEDSDGTTQVTTIGYSACLANGKPIEMIKVTKVRPNSN